MSLDFVNVVFRNTMDVNNDIEYFGPPEFPIRRVRTQTRHDIRHRASIDMFRQVRGDLCRFQRYSSHMLGDLGKLLRQYNLGAYSFLNDATINYQFERRAIRETTLAQHTAIDSFFFCHLSPAYLKAKHEARTSEKALLNKAASVFEHRKEDLLEAKELMYRQLIMNAFLTCELSWRTESYVLGGIRQGTLSEKVIEAPHLRKELEDSPDGVYRLRLTWLPAPGATRYPARLYIDRLTSGEFATEHIIWRKYDRDNNDWESYPYRTPTVPIEATIRCGYVADSQRQDRVLVERREIAEAAYKKTLLPWQRLVYKTGDYQKSQFIPVQPSAIRPLSIQHKSTCPSSIQSN